MSYDDDLPSWSKMVSKFLQSTMSSTADVNAPHNVSMRMSGM